MPQLPENIRPYVAAVVKHHFWILTVLVPLILLPLLFMGTGRLDSLISAQKSQIESRLSALRGVQGIAEHPNESWSKSVEQQTAKIEDETFAEWSRFWEEQQFLRVWPARLGDDFIRGIDTLRPGMSLERPLLLRYQNTVPDLVRDLPRRMGADDLMADAEAKAAAAAEAPSRGRPTRPPGTPGGPRPGAAPARSSALVAWRGEDQARIAASFKWNKPPSTAQVLLAQEELWVYGLFCDAVKRANASAAGAFDAPIVDVLQLAVGYSAAEDQPGGQGGTRIFLPRAAAGVTADAPAEDVSASPEPQAGRSAGGRPAHPRFSGLAADGTQLSRPDGQGEAPPSGSPDDALREWIYVDFTGRPLTAAELATLPDARLVHLMPFALEMIMDQRRLDAFLADLAAAPIPIDVRQVRINPMALGGQAEGSSPGAGTQAKAGRPFDVTVQLRGTVGLAPPPDRKAIGGGETPPGNGGGE